MGRDSAGQVTGERDLHYIVDLIEQLNNDLAEHARMIPSGDKLALALVTLNS